MGPAYRRREAISKGRVALVSEWGANKRIGAMAPRMWRASKRLPTCSRNGSLCHPARFSSLAVEIRQILRASG